MNQFPIDSTLFQNHSLVVFPSNLYHQNFRLQGNQVILPQWFSDVYFCINAIDGIFVKINNTTFGYVYECSATKNVCFLSEALMRKLKVQQGERIDIQVVTNYQKAKSVEFTVLNQQFQQQLDFETELQKEISKYRALQENDIVRLEKDGEVLLLKAEKCEPQGSGFVCMNETEVEAKAVFIGTGETVWDKPPKK